MSHAAYSRFRGEAGYLRFSGIQPGQYSMHEHFELYHLRSGSLQITVDGQSRNLQSGDLVIIAPFVFHRNEESADAALDVVSISPRLCPEVSRLFGGMKPETPFFTMEAMPPLVSALLAALPELFSQANGVEASVTDAKAVYILNPPHCDGLQPYLSVLLSQLRALTTLIPSDGGSTDAMQQVLQYCTANFHQELTRASVAEACQVSPGLISQTFRRLNTSFRDYINDLRVNHAYRLLINTRKPITEIIYESGFANQGTFNKNFQAHFGKSPREIRRSH